MVALFKAVWYPLWTRQHSVHFIFWFEHLEHTLLLYACISAHGFGHGARTGAVLSALATRLPQLRIVVSSALPRWFLDSHLQRVGYEHRSIRWDVGAIQRDALRIDREATRSALEQLDRQLPGLVAAEADWLCHQDEAPVLIYGDIPWGAVLLAEAIGAPVWLAGNFGWDDIYHPWGGWFKGRAAACRQIYCRAHTLLRLPMALAMDWGLREIAVPLVLGPPPDAAALQRLRCDLGLQAPRERTVLICFGGLGLQVDARALESLDHRWTVVDFGDCLPPAPVVLKPPPLLTPQQLMPLCGRVLTKPGFGTISEALGNHCGLVLVERQGFAESAALTAAVQRHGFHRFISVQQLQSGEWGLSQPLLPPLLGPLASDGAHHASRSLAIALSDAAVNVKAKAVNAASG